MSFFAFKKSEGKYEKYFTYIIFSEVKNLHYIGSTSNLIDRLNSHNSNIIVIISSILFISETIQSIAIEYAVNILLSKWKNWSVF
ncbi:MAG: GIY-YIG nuclease family protein [Chlorobi bacterium]|nr:GIY-YIG nuclease family protein [Chlorobiota bacterium]